jgi:hypothetical protein
VLHYQRQGTTWEHLAAIPLVLANLLQRAAGLVFERLVEEGRKTLP